MCLGSGKKARLDLEFKAFDQIKSCFFDRIIYSYVL